jgi:hypothetical protein
MTYGATAAPAAMAAVLRRKPRLLSVRLADDFMIRSISLAFRQPYNVERLGTHFGPMFFQ